MNRKNLGRIILLKITHVIFFLIVVHFSLFGQILLHTPQNTYVPGEKLWYSVVFSNEEFMTSTLPITHIVLYDLDANVIHRHSFRPEENVFMNYIIIPIDLPSGSYILTSSVHDQYNYEVLLEHSEMVHVLGDQKSKYHVFEQGDLKKENPKMLNGKEIYTRDLFCLSDKVKEGIISISSLSFFNYESSFIYKSDSTEYQKEQRLRFKIESKDEFNWLALYEHTNRQVLIPDINDNDGEYILTLPDHDYAHNFQAVNAYNGEELSFVESQYPRPKWQESRTSEIAFDDQIIAELKKHGINRSKLTQVFNTEPENRQKSSNAIQELKLEPDRSVDFNNYDPFESIELFIKEALPAVKLVKNKRTKQLVLVNGDQRGYFNGPPLIIIDGYIEPSLDTFLNIPFKYFEKIEIYRTRAKLDSNYKLMGNFGVIQVSTKNRNVMKKPDVIIDAMAIKQEYNNVLPSSILDTRPFLSNVQHFKVHKGGKFCYTHNDESGAFRLLHIELSEPFSKIYLDYDVSVKIEE